jgi:hypothetical protein
MALSPIAVFSAPVVFVVNADAPTAVVVPRVVFCAAPAPRAVKLFVVVFADPAFIPKATFDVPVVLEPRALEPIAVIEPVVLAKPA